MRGDDRHDPMGVCPTARRPPLLDQPTRLLPYGALAVSGAHLAIHGRCVCLYDYGDTVLHYFSPSLSSARVPIRSGSDAWKSTIHDEDREWLVELHDSAIAHAAGYEALFRYVDPMGRRVLWVVDRQEPTAVRGDVRFEGMSLEVTDIVDDDDVSDRPPPKPLPLEIYRVLRPEAALRDSISDTSARTPPYVALPVSAPLRDAWSEALHDGRDEGVLSVADGPEARGEGTLLTWTPLHTGTPRGLLAVAVGDATEHVAGSAARRRELSELARAHAGAGFHLGPGGRVRVRRGWLERIDATLHTYSDLLAAAPGHEVRALRETRRRAMDGLEGYLAVLTCQLAGRSARVVEAGLPNDDATDWECALFTVPEGGGNQLLERLGQLTVKTTFDPQSRLFRALLHADTSSRLTRMLAHAGEHEAHVRRRLAMLEDWSDPSAAARRFSHSLAAPPRRSGTGQTP
jgi:hypothetical protein